MTAFNNVYKNKRVLITGDTGFKGSWLVIWLTELGAEVNGYALPPKTVQDNYFIANLGEKIKHEDGDIRDREHLKNFFNKTQPDFAFHFAAQPLVLDSYNDPHYTFETNLMGTVNFFEAVRGTKSVKVAVNITSDKCYQNNEWIWGYRENDAMGGKDPYSASKGASELITHSYLHSFFQKDGSANIATARAGNVIGGGDWAANRVVPDFFRALKINEALELRYPEATRPWQHVLEPLGGYLALAMNLYTIGKEFSGGWNFGPTGSTNQSVRNLVEKLIEFSDGGSYSAPEFDDKFHEAGLLNLDISKAMYYLNWKPVLNFDETVKMTVEGYSVESSRKDIYDERVKQISDYVELARQRNIVWSSGKKQ